MTAVVSPGVLGVLVLSDNADVVLEEAQRIRQLVCDPVALDTVEMDINITAGIAIHSDGETGVRQATIALDQARENHSGAAVYNAERYGDPTRNLTLMSRMIAATRNGDMELHYQPKLHLRSGEFRAAEALCRWRDGDGYIPPLDFIPLAEKTGHIRAITEWSIEKAVADQNRLAEAGHSLEMAINISGAVLADSEFAERAMKMAAAARGQLIFEVTETAIMSDPERAMTNLEAWAESGIKISIDDYGSGLSSLAYLRTLPSRELKLDRAFVTNVTQSRRDQMLVRSTVDLAHNLGLEMTAEGVESENGLALLKLLGCDWAQGYLMSKALPVDALIGFLARTRARYEIASPDGLSPMEIVAR